MVALTDYVQHLIGLFGCLVVHVGRRLRGRVLQQSEDCPVRILSSSTHAFTHSHTHAFTRCVS